MADGFKISAADRRKINALTKKLETDGYGRGASKFAMDAWLVRTGQMPGIEFNADRKDPYIEYGIVKPAKRRFAAKTKKK